MIIKGLFRRYKRWNPVHPTSGAFWGMGIGIGCGVGWGPGFGPEVVGYVGAGCGVGFCVGFTFGGVGIGLPSNWLYQQPYEALVALRSGASELVRHNGFLSTLPHSYGLENMASHICMLRKEASSRFRFLNQSQSLDKMVNFHLPDVKGVLPLSTKSITESFKLVGQGFLCNSQADERSQISFSALVALRSGASELVRHNGFLSTLPHSYGLENMASHICMLRKEASSRFRFLNQSQSLDKMVNFHLPDVKGVLPLSTKSITESFKLVGQGFFPQRKDSEDRDS